jgi:WD40 repeat protein
MVRMKVMGDESGGRRAQAPAAELRPPGNDGDDVCPYQGLAPFEIESSELFFGRARATRGLLERLGPRLEEHGSILLVSGASGVGKSSLLRAGLIPALAEGMLPVAGSRHWPRLIITPTANPLRALAEGWTEAYGGSVETVHEQLRDDPSPVGRLVLVVDQFEELFTLVTDEQERQAFVRALHAMAEGTPGAGVIIGLRADYWDRCAAYPQFAEAIQDGQVIVEPMTESDLRLAVTGPAAAVGLEIEPGLVETVLGELRADRTAGDRYETGALPLLSQALRNTWDRRENGRLTIRGYEESGRVRDSVRRTADEVLQRLSAEDRKTALKLFRRMTLITAGGRVARRRVTLTEIHAAASAQTAERRGQVDALLSAFAGRRLLTLNEDTAEIAHDALLTAWPTLRQWLEPDLTAQAVYDRLIDDAAEWAGHGRDPAFLYRGARLLSVQDTRPRWDRDPDSFPPPGPTVENFTAASTRAARRAGRRRGLIMAGLALLSALALVSAGAALNAANEADHQRSLAVSRQLAAQSEVAGDPVISSLLAVAAWRIAPTAEARQRMLAAAARTGRGVLTGHSLSVRSLAFSPDGTIIATGGGDGTARLWDTASRRQLGAPIAHPRQECVPEGPQVAFSPDGRMLATACIGTVRFWDVATRRELSAPLDNGIVVSAIAFAPDRRTLAVASLKGSVRLWDVATGRPLGDAMGRAGTRPGNTRAIKAVVFSSDGKHLATAGADDTARLWDTATYDQIGASFTGHTDDVEDVSFSPDGTTLATASTDATARLWNLATHRQTGTALTAPGGTGGFNGIAFSPDGTRLATAGDDGSTRLWDTVGHREVSALADNRFQVRRVAFSPDGRLLAAAGEDGVVRLGNPVVHQQVGATMRGRSAIALSPDGRTLATGGPSADDSAAQLWGVATQRRIGRPLEPADGPLDVYGISFGPDGRTLMTTGLDGVRIWDTASRRQIGPPVYTGRPLGIVKLSPDGRFFAVQHGDSVLFWDVTDRRETGPRVHVPGHTDVISAMAMSPDGASVATAGFDRKVRVFDVATGRQVGPPLPVATNGFLDALAFSPDGRTLAVTADNETVRLWDLAGRRPVGGALTGHTAGITAIAFSPDGKALVTGSVDHTVRLWDLLTNRQIGSPLTGHTRTVTGIAYSPDGATAATVSNDGTARLWNVALPADPAATVCADVGRSLTRAEWERYVPQEKFRKTCR